jgi:hypothetical protein
MPEPTLLSTANIGTNEGLIPALGAGGKLASSLLPSIALTETLSVANAAARLALTSAQAQGKIVIEADTEKSYGLVTAGNPATSGDWLQLGDNNVTAAEITDSTAAGRALLTAADAAAQIAALGAATPASVEAQIEASHIADERLWNFRNEMSLTGRKPHILLLGDSMLNLAWSQGLRESLVAAFGYGGLGMAEKTLTSPAVNAAIDCGKWITGDTITLPLNGISTFHGGGAGTPIAATLMRVYYLIQPDGGHFKIQYERNGGTWTDVPGFTDIDTAGTLAGGVANYDLTAINNHLSEYRIRVVGLGDGAGGAATVDPTIIGCSIVDNQGSGAIITLMGNNSSSSPSNNLDAQSTTPRAITDPIFAALRCNLIFTSNYDGATFNTTYLPTVMDNVNAGILSAGTPPTPSWVLIGPPPGQTSIEGRDASLAAQAAAMRVIAEERGESFFDNRIWALPYERAVANGLMEDGDVHYLDLAVKHWVPMMINALGIDRSPKDGNASSREIRFPKGAIIGDVTSPSSYLPRIRLQGSLEISNKPGETTHGMLKIFSTLPESANNAVTLSYASNQFAINMNALTVAKFGPGVGAGFVLWDSTATTATPRGVIGNATTPLRAVYMGKTEATTTGNQSPGQRQHGTVKFAAGSSTPIVVTNSLAGATANILAQVYGTDDTLTSVRITRAAGSFTITPNAAATSETTVGWFVLP